MIDRHAFEHHVKDALSNLYDPIYLQTHPLAPLLELGADQTASSGQKLRSELRKAVETLKPPKQAPSTSKEWLRYQVILLRYVRVLECEEICDRLAISESTFYRRQREGVDALTATLWERCLRLQELGDGPGGSPGSAEEMRREALRAACRLPWETVGLELLMRRVRKTAGPLLEGKGLSLQLHIAAEPQASVRGPVAVVGQVLIELLLAGARFAAASHIKLDVAVGDGCVTWRIQPLKSTVSADIQRTEAWELVSELTSGIEGRVWLVESATQTSSLNLALPLTPTKTVLVVDDDRSAAELYRRYVAHEAYAVHAAETMDDLVAQVRASRPDVILLDILLPGTDGWLLLQQLAADPSTTTIPVIVCSVLDTPELALQLGASAVLTKPIGSEKLIQAIRRVLS